MKLYEHSLPESGEIILQLRRIWIFFPVSSLEMNVKNTDLNHASARGFYLFLLIVQTLEQHPPNIFLIIFDTFLVQAVHLAHFPAVSYA